MTDVFIEIKSIPHQVQKISKTKMEFDVAIVGASCAGSRVAEIVATAGFSVALIEKLEYNQIGHPWINIVESKIFEELDIEPPSGIEFVPNPDFLRIKSPGYKLAKDVFVEGVYSIYMKPFNKRLLDKALKRGAKLIDRCVAIAPIIKNDYVVGLKTLKQDKDTPLEIKAKVIVDASGYSAVLRRKHFNPDICVEIPNQDTVSAWEQIHKINPKFLSLALENEKAFLRANVLTLGAYGGLTSIHMINENMVSILSATQIKADYPRARNVVQIIVNQNPFIGEKICGGGGIIPVRRPLDTFVDNGFMLVGDSACQVVPTFGSGVASALFAATIAGRTIINSLKRKDYSLMCLWEYNRGFLRTRGAILASYDIFRLQGQRLSQGEISHLFQMGLISPELIEKMMRSEPITIPPLLMARLIANLLRNRRFLSLVLNWNDARRIYKFYRNYPYNFVEKNFKIWQRNVKAIFDNYYEKPIF